MGLSKISKKWLTTIPADVRDFLGAEEGDIIVWEIDEPKGIVSVRIVKNPIKSLKGKYSDPNLRYEAVEEKADKIIAGIIYAGDRA